MVRFVNDPDEFEALVAARDAVLVDFTASWCGPCRNIAPFFEELAAQHGGGPLEFVKVDVDQNPDTSSRYQIRAMPTFVLFLKGQVAERVRGADRKKLQALAEQHGGPPALMIAQTLARGGKPLAAGEAVGLAQQRKAPLLVVVTQGENYDLQAALVGLQGHPLAKSLVALHIEHGSVDYGHFAHFFNVPKCPWVGLIAPDGAKLAELTEGFSPGNLVKKFGPVLAQLALGAQGPAAAPGPGPSASAPPAEARPQPSAPDSLPELVSPSEPSLRKPSSDGGEEPQSLRAAEPPPPKPAPKPKPKKKAKKAAPPPKKVRPPAHPRRRRGDAPPSPGLTPSSPAPKPEPVVYDFTDLRIQQLGGEEPLWAKFAADDTVQAVYQWVDLNRTDGNAPYALHTAWPRRELSEADLDTQLRELDLVPRAALVMVPVGGGGGGGGGGAAGLLAQLGALFAAALAFLLNLPTLLFPPAPPAVPPPETTGRSRLVGGGAGPNIHGLAAEEAGGGAGAGAGGDDDRNAYWNGNSTQFGSRDDEDKKGA